jgi:hypothetical protein
MGINLNYLFEVLTNSAIEAITGDESMEYG